MLTQHLGWRSVFAISALLALAGWALARPGGTEKKPREPVVQPASLWLFAAGVALVLGGLAMTRVQWRFAAVAAVGAIAVLLSFRGSSNLPLEPALFRNTAFTFSNLAALIHYAATFSVSLFLALYLQLVGGLSPRATGFLLLAQPLLMALLSPLAGSVSDRWEPRWVATVGMALTAGGLMVLSLAQARVSLFQVISGLALLGIGFALFSSPNTHAVMGQAPGTLLSAASATLALMRLTGQAGSLVLASFFLPATNLDTQAGKLLLPGMQANLGVASLLCLLGMAFSLARGKVHV